MIVDYFRLAIGTFKKRKVRSFLTMLGIFIGIAAVVSLISLGSGMKNAITEQFATLGTDKITVQAAGVPFGPPGSTVANKLTQDVTREVERVRGIDLVLERMIRAVRFEYNDQEKFESISNIPEGEARDMMIEVLNLKVEKGRMLQESDRGKVFLGNNFDLESRYGKQIDVGSRVVLNDKTFEVIGIAERTGNPGLNGLVLLNDEEFRRIIDVGDEVDLIAARVKPGTDMDKVIEAVEKRLRKFRNVEEGKEDFSVESAQQSIEALNSILNVVQWVLAGIAGISLFVGGIGIMNTMFTSVLERKREIGVMKSVGAKNSDVLLLFLVESGLLGVVGGLIGLMLGFILGKSVEVIGQIALGSQLLRADFSLTLIIGSLLFSFIVGSISGIAPAYQASKLQPVEALRK